MQRLLREGGGALQENIPPASVEERLAAEAERSAPPVPDPVAVKKSTPPQVIPQLPMPGLLPEFEVEVDVERTETVRVTPRTAIRQENERLRALLTETLAALEELRSLLG